MLVGVFLVFFGFVCFEHVLSVELRLWHLLCGWLPLILHLCQYRFLMSGEEEMPMLLESWDGESKDMIKEIILMGIP